MAILAVDGQTGRILPSEKLQLVNKLWHLRWTKPKWEVIEAVVDAWIKMNPTKWDAYLIRLKDIKETRKVTYVGNKRFRGVSRDDKKNDAITSYLVDIPQWIILLLRKLYTHEELPMDKKFFREFGRRFPIFLIREKV